MDRIIFNDDVFEETYSLNPNGIFGDDVGDWTMEEFYQEFDTTKLPGSKLLYKWALANKAKKELKEKLAAERMTSMFTNAPVSATVLTELKNWEEIPKMLGTFRIRLRIFEGAMIALKIIQLCTSEVMFRARWGRFPADLKSFYEYAFEMPQELKAEDIKKFKAELKKLRKDTKWLVGKAGNEFITPKERQLVELMNKQVEDLLTWRMLPKDLDVQKTRRIQDRVTQFIETSHEFLKLIHDDMEDTKTKNTMKDAIK